MKQVISLTYGHAILELPDRLCAVDISDLEESLEIQFRVLKRMAKEKSIQDINWKAKALFFGNFTTG